MSEETTYVKWTPFKCGFDIEDWHDILPEFPEYESGIPVLNIGGVPEADQFWKKQEFPRVITHEWILEETRRLKEGIWMMNKGMAIWIPPNYYQFLQYGNAGGNPPEFRLKRLKNIYKKIRVRKDAHFLGTYNIKNRQDGDTTMAMSDCLWEVISGELTNGLIGIQSKTNEDARNPCWFNLKSTWLGYPLFFKQAFYSSFSSGDNIETKLQFSEPADPSNPYDLGKNVEIKYGPSVHNAFDGKSNMRKCVMDEVNKWIVCSFKLTFANYKKFMMPGNVRKGLFDIISSPADTNGTHNNDAYAFWQDSDPDKLQETGSTKTRVVRMYSNPLDGIDGFYDKYGDADPQQIYEHIKRERASARPEDLMSEVRAFPLPILNTDKPDEDELFGATDTQSVFFNEKGIKARSLVVKAFAEPKVVYGNLEWPNNVPYGGIPRFRMTDLDRFDNTFAPFCFATTELPRIALRDLHEPPDPMLIEGVIGCDPFNNVNHTRNKTTQSLGAAVDWRFRDLSGSGWEQSPTGMYLARPGHKKQFHEDMIKFCLFTRSMIQYENSDGGELHDAFLDRGFQDWMLDSKDGKMIERPFGLIPRKGDAPAGRGATGFMQELINLIDGVTAMPYNKEERYLLDHFMFHELLDDLTTFNKDDTRYNHLTMALGQALLGMVKLMFKKSKERDDINDLILEAMYG